MTNTPRTANELKTTNAIQLFCDQAVTVSKTGDQVRLDCNSYDDAELLFEWLSTLGALPAVNPEPKQNPTVAALNVAFEADPHAMHALLCNRVPCNNALAEDPHMVAESCPVLPEGSYQIGALGLINGVLSVNDLPLVASKFTDTRSGTARFDGFCEYKP